MAGRVQISRAEPGFTMPAFERLAPPPPPELVRARLEAASQPGDIVAVTFSRPKNPKDLENTTWSTLAGQMNGIISDIGGADDEKVMTVRVSPNGPPL